MRQLLTKDTEFVWTEVMEKEFKEMKEMISGPLYVKPFNTNHPANYLLDVSKLHGAGYLLYQQEEGKPVSLIKCGSVSAIASWAWLSALKIEAVGAHWAPSHSAFYARGYSYINLFTDHKPLVTLFTGPLQDLSDRMLKIRSEMLQYNLHVTYTPGRHHRIADAMSRRPHFTNCEYYDPLRAIIQDEDINAARFHYVNQNPRVDNPALLEMFRPADKEVDYGKVVDEIEKGRTKAEIHLLPTDLPAQSYKFLLNQLGVLNGPQVAKLLAVSDALPLTAADV
jgi:hypothetical protein